MIKYTLKALTAAAFFVFAAVGPAPAARLPGQYAIGNIGYNYFWTAREGGRHTIGGVVTNARTVGPHEKFTLETMNPNYKLLLTANNYYVTAAAGGGLGANYDAGQVIQAAVARRLPHGIAAVLGPVLVRSSVAVDYVPIPIVGSVFGFNCHDESDL